MTDNPTARFVSEIASEDAEARLCSLLGLLNVAEANYRAVRLMLAGLRGQHPSLEGDGDLSAVITCLDRAVAEYSALAYHVYGVLQQKQAAAEPAASLH